MRPILVAGIGHTLMSDDAFGPTVIATLEREGGFASDVELADFGTSSADFTEAVLDRDFVVVIDALASNGEAGTIAEFDLNQRSRVEGVRMSSHQPDINGAFGLAELMDRAPRQANLVGVVPASTELGVGLSPAVAAAVDRVAKRVRAIVEGYVV